MSEIDVFSIYEIKDCSCPDSDVYLGSFPNKKSAEDFINKYQYFRENCYIAKEILCTIDKSPERFFYGFN